MTTQPLTDEQLAARIAGAIRAAAYDCDGNCGLDERECDAQHPIQVAVLHHGEIADVYGSVDAIAATVLAVVQPELDRLRAANQKLNRRCQRAESQLVTITRAVNDWQIGDRGAYVPLRTLTAIAKAVGRNIDGGGYELHYQRVERAERERDEAQAETEQLRAELHAARAQVAVVLALPDIGPEAMELMDPEQYHQAIGHNDGLAASTHAITDTAAAAPTT